MPTTQSSVLPDYNPTFSQPIKGTWKDNTHFVALNVGSDAYVMEREVNEAQWLNVDNAAKTLKQITKSGILTIDKTNNLEKCFKIINNNTTNLNGFELPPFDSVVNGFLTHHEYYRTGETKKNIPIRLPNPPVGDVRHDFVFLEFWFSELKKNDKVPMFGYDINSPMDFNIIDERIEAETSRRIQLQWTISHYEDFDNKYSKGFVDADGKPNESIHPLAQNGYRAKKYFYKQSENDPYLFIAGEGLIANPTIHTIDGYVYAIPLFRIMRLNNSGYDEKYNPFGGVDWVDENTKSDRPDGKFSNIIYDDQITDLRHLAPLSEEQYNKIYTTLTEYYTDETSMKNKIYRMTEDLENLSHIIKNLGYDLPSIHDKEIYGIEMFHQYGQTAGAMVDEDDEDKKIIYRKRKYYVGHQLENKDYTVIPTLIDYDWEDKGKIGDLFVEKQAKRFRVYNTGTRNLKMNLETILIDNEVVYSGEGTFSGMDGTFITMPFKLDDDRYFIHICAKENTNGRNGEIFVKCVDNQIIVYNTGITTDKKSNVVQTTGNKFQWTVIDMYSKTWKNINYVNATLAGQQGVSISSKEFGENYRLSLGTPILTTNSSIEEGSIGDLYADIDNDDIFTVYNTGSAGATVQCLVFNDIPYEEYYDTLNVPMNIILPNIVVKSK
jgi:DNA-binding cell septation regulator SpoVG